jgi:hypothetical protein
MKLTIELDTNSPAHVEDVCLLGRLLEQLSNGLPTSVPHGVVELTTVEEPAPKKKRTRKKAAPKVEEPVVEDLPLVEEPAPMADKAAVSAAVTELIRVKGRPAAREVLTALDAIDDKGLPRISCIDESRYSEALTLIAEQL